MNMMNPCISLSDRNMCSMWSLFYDEVPGMGSGA